MKLFCIFAFERGTRCIQIGDELVDKIRLHWRFCFFLFNRYSCVSLQCLVLSLVTTILVFSFHVVGRRCLIEILGYIVSLCFFGGVP